MVIRFGKLQLFWKKVPPSVFFTFFLITTVLLNFKNLVKLILQTPHKKAKRGVYFSFFKISYNVIAVLSQLNFSR